MARACVRCKLKKLKCDGMKPSCSTCLKLGLRCETPIDKRVDKRRFQNGVSLFVFKNAPVEQIRERSGSPRTREKSVSYLAPPPNTANHLPVDSPQVSQKNINEVNFNPIPWLNLEDFGELQIDLDIDEFLRNLDYSFGLELPDSLRESIPSSPLPHLQNESVTLHQMLIDTVFGDTSHTPKSVTRSMIESIANKTYRSEDESFLLSTVLAIGALTLAKQNYAEQRRAMSENDSVRLKTPLVASEAYHHFQDARKLNSHILEHPSKNGFRGLALISNFLSGLLTLEAQMIVSYQALQVACSIGMHCRQSSEPVGEEFGLTIAFWELWCSACLFSSFHGRPLPLRKEDIITPSNLNITDKFSKEFFLLRIRLAELHSQLANKKANGNNGVTIQGFQEAVGETRERLYSLAGSFPTSEQGFHRQELLIMELKCWMSQAVMLEGEHALIKKLNIRSFIEAKKIINDLWNHYNPEIFGKGAMLRHLDWNFTYPLRTATICAFTAVRVLTLFINSVDYLSYDYFHYQLGRKVLESLTDMMPINKHLLEDLDALKIPN